MSPLITRRAACALGAAALATPAAIARPLRTRTERWGLQEITLKGPAGGNPFLDTTLSAVFTCAGKSVEAKGFYDGDGIYRIRFMPGIEGHWEYRTKSNARELDGKSGAFEVGPPSANNHGPVTVANTYHFAYADGRRYLPFGTTSYSWTHQADALCEQTLKTLAVSPFNKIRMLALPSNTAAPLMPFPGTPPRGWNFTRFNLAYFQRLDRYVGRLNQLGIEADIILFHPYDRGEWGFGSMPAEVDDRYLRYIVARLSAYRNVWWSMANEYDLLKLKTDADFDRMFQVVQAEDPYGHLRSVHNMDRLYNNSHPWVTHASIQNGAAVGDDARAVLYRDVWRKPVVFDEVGYEGAMDKRWGNLKGEELVRRCWEGAIAGTYVGHGETIPGNEKHAWTGDGGRLKGESPARMGFLRKLMEEGPQVDPLDRWYERHIGGLPGEYYLRYFGRETPQQWPFVLPDDELKDGQQFTVDIIDTWAMTVTPVPGKFTVRKLNDYEFADTEGRSVALPGKPWLGLRIRKV